MYSTVLLICGIILCGRIIRGQILHQAAVGELYTFKIEPTMFNWSRQSLNEQFRYTTSLKSYPDLPSWLRYMYSEEHHAGFLYGTTPDHLLGKSITLDIVALNRRTYETRISELTIMVKHKVQAPNVVQMKIDNLNWVHLMDPGRVENLRNIFRKELWVESADDLNLVFMESAVKMGGRLPLRPQQYEGFVIIYLNIQYPIYIYPFDLEYYLSCPVFQGNCAFGQFCSILGTPKATTGGGQTAV